MTAGLVLISYAQGRISQRLFGLASRSTLRLWRFSAHLRAALAWPHVMGLKPTLPYPGSASSSSSSW